MPMNRRFPIPLWPLALILGFTGIATAGEIPFQISGSSMSVDWDLGGGLIAYTPNIMSTPIELDQGESADVTFGTVRMPVAVGTGSSTFSVDFAVPDPDGPVSSTGHFRVISLLFFRIGSMSFADPQPISYSFEGMSGGQMTVSFNDISGVAGGTSQEVTGTITNITSPSVVSPVPEPSLILLLGLGIGAVHLLFWRMNK
jgi:hypothetical protein